MEYKFKISICLFLMFLSVSPLFTSTIVFGQNLEATCAAVSGEETKVIYCKKPITLYDNDGNTAKTEGFESPQCPEGKYPVSCLTKSGFWDTYPDFYANGGANDGIVNMNTEGAICYVVATDIADIYSPHFQNRSVGVVCSGESPDIIDGVTGGFISLVNWNDTWQESNKNFATFTSPDCPVYHDENGYIKSTYPVSCLTESDVNNDTSYQNHVIVSMKIEGSHCVVSAYDSSKAYEPKQKRKVGVVCSKDRPIIKWSDWEERNNINHDGYSASVETFTSDQCDPGYYPIACLTDSDQEFIYEGDAIVTMNIENSRCVVKAFDARQVGATIPEPWHKRKVGVVCSRNQPVLQEGDWSSRSEDITGYRHFVYVYKSNKNIPIELGYKGLEIPPSKIELLHETKDGQILAQRDENNKIIRVADTGTFDINSDEYHDLSLNALDSRVEMQGFDDCVNAVAVASVMNEDIRNEALRNNTALADFLSVVTAGLAMVESQIRPVNYVGFYKDQNFHHVPWVSLQDRATSVIKDHLQEFENWFGDQGALRVYNPEGPETTSGTIPEFVAAATGTNSAIFIRGDKTQITAFENFINSILPNMRTRIFVSTQYPDKATLVATIYPENPTEQIPGTPIVADIGVHLDSIDVQRASVIEQYGTNRYTFANPELIQAQSGYPKLDSDYYRDGGTIAETIYKAWKNNQPIPAEMLYARWVFKDPNDPKTLAYARQYGLDSYATDPYIRGESDAMLDSNRNKWIETVVKKYRLSVADEASLDNFLPTRADARTKMQTLYLKYITTGDSLLYLGHLINIYEISREISDVAFIGYQDRTFKAQMARLERLRNWNYDEFIAVSNEPVSAGREVLLDIIAKNEQLADTMLTWRDDPNQLLIRAKHFETMGVIVKEVAIQAVKTDGTAGSMYKGLIDAGYQPSDEAIYSLDNLAQKAVKSSDDLGDMVGGKYNKVVGESLGLPREESEPLSMGANFLRGVGIGFGMAAFFQLRPAMMLLWEHYQNYAALWIANGIEIFGYGLTIYYYSNIAYTFIGALLATTFTAIEVAGVVLSTFAGIGVGWILCLVIGRIVSIIFYFLWCTFWAPPGSPECGCTTNPVYGNGKPMLRLASNIVTKGGTLKYVVYGLLYCYPTTPSTPPNYYAELYYTDNIASQSEKNNVADHVYNSTTNGYIPSDVCVTLDGRCFECSVNVLNPTEENTYYVSGSYGKYAYFRTGFYVPVELGHTDWSASQVLKVCPMNNVGDESENKCVKCDSFPPTTGTCQSVGGYCEVPRDCKDGYKCDTLQRECTQYPATCCCIPSSQPTVPSSQPTVNGICEYDCGADSRCDEFSSGQKGNCPSDYYCDSNCQCHPSIDIGLGSPIIEPISPSENTGFKIYCPTNGNQQYDCIDAYANIVNGNPVDRCSWITVGGGWIENKAVFSCNGRTVGEYNAVCLTRPTSSNCKPAQTQTQYNICKVGVEDTDNGINYKVKGTCNQYLGYSNGECKIAPYVISNIPNTDHCACVPKCSYEQYKNGDKDCNLALVGRCYGYGLDNCKNDQRCTPGLLEYYVDNSACSFSWTNCTEFGSNYTCIDGRCGICGDINGDKVVNLQDLVLLALAYGTTPSSNKGIGICLKCWNPNADLNKDNAVGLSDLVILANSYGKC
jgi:hypothetical protein